MSANARKLSLGSLEALARRRPTLCPSGGRAGGAELLRRVQTEQGEELGGGVEGRVGVLQFHEDARPGFAERDVMTGDERLGVIQIAFELGGQGARQKFLTAGRNLGERGGDEQRAEAGAQPIFIDA